MTGLVRAKVHSRETKGNWGSLAMLVICLAIALLFQPYWIAALGAVVATAVEKLTAARKWLDDNYTTCCPAWWSWRCYGQV